MRKLFKKQAKNQNENLLPKVFLLGYLTYLLNIYNVNATK